MSQPNPTPSGAPAPGANVIPFVLAESRYRCTNCGRIARLSRGPGNAACHDCGHVGWKPAPA